MSPRLRGPLLGIGLVLLGAVLLRGMHALPAVGDYRGPYGDVINSVAQTERNVTDMVSAVNFDYRSIDTLGEEYILFISVAGVMCVLRRTRLEHEEAAAEDPGPRRPPRTSDAVRLWALGFVAPVVVTGLYIVTHGQLSPGGGFQGGVILGTALMLVFLAGRYRRMAQVGPLSLVELADAAGAGGFALIGVATLVAGGAFLANVLNLGTAGTLTAGGSIALVSAAIGLEVAGGILVITTEFLEQALRVRGSGGG